jgi:predicted pyridoxine 5'-phosphate oxidase superfamily flavin-nucleotide-binding protein
MGFPSDVAFTESVKRIQRERGSRSSYARKENLSGGFAGDLTAEVVDFIAQRDSAFLATSNAAGQPYVQHRGGPPGFIQAIDARTLAFPDFMATGNTLRSGILPKTIGRFCSS